MIRYKNLGGNSSVIAYEYDTTSIRVQFGDDSVYEYTNEKPGEKEVGIMIKLAEIGQGLCGYINSNKHVRFGYARRIK